MIKKLVKIIKDYVPDIKTLNTIENQAKVIQDLYEQVIEFYNYITNPTFKYNIGVEDGKSSYALWKEIPGNENKSITDYFNEIITDPRALHGNTKVIHVSNDIEVINRVDTNTQLSVIYINDSENAITVTMHPITNYLTPDGQDIELSILPNGYGEINYLNINDTIFARGG